MRNTSKLSPKGSLLVLSIVLVALIGTATALYHAFSASYRPDSLVIQTESTESDKDSAQTESADLVIAPNFVMTDSEGAAVQLHDFLGKPIVLNFWASWCGPCKMEMPHFEQAYTDLQTEVQFILVNLTDGQRETPEIANRFIADNEYTFPVYFDTQQEGAYAYGVHSIPLTLFIDKEGYVVAGANTTLDAATLDKGIDMIFSDEQ